MLRVDRLNRRRVGLPRSRAGFTLPELIIVMVLLAVIGGTLIRVILQQQRFYRGTSLIMDTRSQMRQAVDILSAELRGISAAGGDIYAGGMTSTALDFRSTFGSGLACRILNFGTQIYIPPNQDLAAGNRLTFMGGTPAVGHGVFILDEGATPAGSDDVWQLRTITAVNTAFADPCIGTTYTGAGDAAKTGYMVTLNAAVPGTVAAGAPVRFVKRVRYGIYTASDGNAYLGYCESGDLVNPCGAYQPVAGPYRAGVADASLGTSGLSFYYYDESGNVTADRLAVARVELAVRGITRDWVSRGGEAAKGYFTDSARVVVGVRNRR